MRRWWLIALPLLAGCDLLFRLKDIQPPPPDADPSTIDADVGLLIDAGPCMGSTKRYGRSGPNGEGLFSICLTPSAGTLDLSGQINAGEDARCLVVEQDTAGTRVCVLVAGTINVDADLRATGMRPLVLLATDTLTVTSTIDVASALLGPNNGAGANWTNCGPPSNGLTTAVGGHGGAGGSFGTAGGAGGASGTSNSMAMPRAPAPIDRIRGGCEGGKGGISSGTAYLTDGGDSGGAIYLIAGNQIELRVTAAINASGAGAHGGAPSMVSMIVGGAGGGGGGSGGLIGLDAPTIVIDPNAKLMANGGGGGAGGTLVAGKDGFDPSLSAVRTRAPGGAGATNSGAGGLGAAIAAATGGSGSSGSGGGGGGGAGAIVVFGVTLPGTVTSVSPAWRINPR